MTQQVEDTDMEDQRTLTALDRCDRCGAQAYLVTEHSGTELLWCAHHAREHREALAASIVHDEMHKLA